MRPFSAKIAACIAALFLSLYGMPKWALTGESEHRLLVLDRPSPPIGPQIDAPPQLKILDMDHGKTLFRADVGRTPDFALSQDSHLIAVVSSMTVAGSRELMPRLAIFSSKDLSKIAEGDLPFKDRWGYGLAADWPVLCFSSDNRAVVIPRGEPHMVGQAPRQLAQYDCHWTPVEWQAGDGTPLPAFRQSSQWKVPFTTSARSPILSSRFWPQVDLTNRGYGTIQTIDFSSGKIVNRLLVTDNPAARTLDPELMEKKGPPDVEMLYSGVCTPTPTGRSAYFIPEPRIPGWIKRIDLTQRPPAIVAASQVVHGDLDSFRAAASDEARVLCVARGRLLGLGEVGLPDPRHVKIFNSVTLDLIRVIELDMTFSYMLISCDGTQLYLVGHEPPSIIEVMDTKTGKILNTFRDLVKWPIGSLPLPPTGG